MNNIIILLQTPNDVETDNNQENNELAGSVTGTVINILHNILGVGVLAIAITLNYGTLVIA